MNRVLVVVPTVERPKVCARALRSLHKQKFTDWDCVVVKNGNVVPDREYSLALGPMLNGKVVMIGVDNASLPGALNEGCRKFLKGHEFFAVLEDDDEWMPKFLANMVRTLDLAGTSKDVANCYQRQLPDKKQSNGGHMDFSRLLRQNWINFPMCLFRERLFKDAGGFDELAGPATDWAWHLACVYEANAGYKFVNEELVVHHWHGKNYCLNVTNADYVKKKIKEKGYK